MTITPDDIELMSSDIYQQLALRPGFLIRRLHQIHVALFAEECAAFNVTPVQYSIMTVLGAQPGLEQARVAYEVGVDRTTMADVLARLESRTLVRRKQSPADKRMKLAELTPSGRKLLRDMDRCAQRAHDRTVAALSPQERAQFTSYLVRLVDANNDFGRAPMRLG
jgi:DNA-binding MarR family transcriptional regulator